MVVAPDADATPAPLHEKMVLFWHGHFTSSADKASADMVANQHNLFRRHALGNFRELAHAIVRDAAMLMFLDGADSSADDPNENLARELMELFTIGRGPYTQADVRAAATALAGFTVDWESEAVGFDEESASTSSLTVLGVTDTFDSDRLIDVLCDHEACAPFIAGKLFRYFVGSTAAPARLTALAATFRDHDLEIRPLVEAIVTGEEFAASRLARPRFPVEWHVAAMTALGVEIVADDVWNLGELGQLPFYPPNVAGWPVGMQWVGAGRQLLRASMTLDRSWPDDYPSIDLGGGSPDERAEAALHHCGLFEFAPTTRSGPDDRSPARPGGRRRRPPARRAGARQPRSLVRLKEIPCRNTSTAATSCASPASAVAPPWSALSARAVVGFSPAGRRRTSRSGRAPGSRPRTSRRASSSSSR